MKIFAAVTTFVFLSGIQANAFWGDSDVYSCEAYCVGNYYSAAITPPAAVRYELIQSEGSSKKKAWDKLKLSCITLGGDELLASFNSYKISTYTEGFVYTATNRKQASMGGNCDKD